MTISGVLFSGGFGGQVAGSPGVERCWLLSRFGKRAL